MKKKVLFSLIILLFTAVTLAFSTVFYNPFVIPKQFLFRLFAVISVVYWVYLYLRYNLKIPRKSYVFWALGYFLWKIVSLFFSTNWILGYEVVLDSLLCGLILLMVISAFTKKEATKMIDFVLFVSLLVGVYSLIQHLGWDPVGWASEHLSLVKGRSISTLGNPDFLSAYLVMVIPFSLVGVFIKENKSWYYSLFLFAFLVFVNLFTYSRAGMVSMFASVVFVLVLLGKDVLLQNRKKIALLFLSILIVFGGLFVFERIGKTSHSLGERVNAFVNPQENNVQTRIYLWKVAGKLVLKHPLVGIGVGTFGINYPPYRYMEPLEIRHRISVPQSSHNFYLDLALFCGVPNLLLFLGFVFSLGYLGWKARKEKFLKGKDWWVYLGYAGGMFAFLVHHLAGFSTLPTDVLFWLFAGFMVVLSCKEEVSYKYSPWKGREKLLKGGVVFFAALCGGVILLYSMYGIMADYYFNLGKAYQGVLPRGEKQYIKEEMFVKGLYYFDKAVELKPLNYFYWLNRGKFLEESSYVFQKQVDDIVNEAIRSYEVAIKLNPKNPYPYADMSRLLFRWGNKTLAKRYQEKALDLDPYNPVLREDYAILLARLKMYKEAEAEFKKVLEMTKPLSWTYGNMGMFYFNRGDFEKSYQFLSKAVSLKGGEKYREVLEKVKKALKEKRKR